MKFEESCSIQNIISFNHKDVPYLFIGYEWDTRPWNQGADFTLGDCLFVAAKNADRGKYSENRFDADSTLPWASREFGKIIVVLGKDNNSSVTLITENKTSSLLVSKTSSWYCNKSRDWIFY